MAIEYWDYYTDTSTDGGYWYWSNAGTSTATTTTSTSDWVTINPTASSTVQRRRTILVKTPKSWNEAILAAYTRLVNDETNTGWTVTMWINGDVKITDPNVEVRKMKDFVPLLKSRASPKDRALIDDFFLERGGIYPLSQ